MTLLLFYTKSRLQASLFFEYLARIWKKSPAVAIIDPVWYDNPYNFTMPKEEISMETRRLYYEDCHLSRFVGKVTACEETEEGYVVCLDATAFYPEGGGQACDLGTLGGVRELDVRERGAEVVHLCDGPLEIGREVEGILDYARRFDLMQQHSGEHIVSGLVCSRYGYHNVGFHVGADVITIDFDGVIPQQDLAALEREANRAVWMNLEVECFVPGPEELPGVFYRTKRALPWPVRIVRVPGVDSCACCGVHVGRRGEIGLIKLLSVTGCRGGTRMEMLCGGRALEMLNTAFEQNRQVSQAFSAQWNQTGAAARRMNQTLEEEKYRMAQLRKRMLDGIARGYANSGDVLHFEEGLEPVQVRELADAVAGCCGGRAAVFSGDDETGYACALVTRSGDLREIGREMTAALKGRGGGKPVCLQGRVSATRQEIREFFHQH